MTLRPESPPRRLYKYVKPERLQDLLSGRIRFTQPSGQNDEFEFKPFYDAASSAEKMLQQIRPHYRSMLDAGMAKAVETLNPSEQALLPDSSILASAFASSEIGRIAFSTVESVGMAVGTRVFQELKARLFRTLDASVGILSLTDTPVNKRMWIRYGDKGQGVAFEFDTDHSWLNRRRGPSDEFGFPQQVNYINLEAPERTFLTLIDENLLLSKGLKWNREREWRVLTPLREAVQTVPHPDGSIHLFRLDVRAVTAVILGPKASSSTVEEVRQLVAEVPRLCHIQTKCVRSTAGRLKLSDF